MDLICISDQIVDTKDQEELDKYYLIKQMNLPEFVINYIASYFIKFENIIKYNLDDLIPYITKPNYSYLYGPRSNKKWITPITICYKYNREDVIRFLINKFDIRITKYDLYALAQMKRWNLFIYLYENNCLLDFCYRLTLQYAEKANAERFIIWLKSQDIIVKKCNLYYNDHQIEHRIYNNIYKLFR